MGFGCPICSEKLEKLPAEGQSRNGGGRGELNISATPCGHIFHAYCIQKWLSGNLASSKQCPCCRKDVPRLRCLSLFPTTYDDSILDDSMSQMGGEGGGAFSAPAPCNHGEIITSLKNQIARLDAEVKDKDTMHKLLTEDHEALMEEFRKEKINSDTWMMKAQQYRSYEDEAHKWESRARNAESQLRNFANVENLLKGVERSVNEEQSDFPICAESIRSLLQMKQVLSNELKKLNTKLTDFKKKYEEVRDEKVKLNAKLDKQEREYKELKHVYEISRVNGRVRSPDYPIAGPSSAVDIGATPKAFKTKRRFLETSQRSVSSEALNAGRTTPGVDQDVDVFPTTFKKSKSTKVLSSHVVDASNATSTTSKSSKSKAAKLPISLSPIPTVNTPQPHEQQRKKHKKEEKPPSPNDTIDIISESDEEDELRIRGNVPGASLPIASSRMKTLQQRSERPTLGLSKTTKKFNFTKKPTSQ